ncbi:HisA/HisF-related TIM barrel protein [Alphaproteobacteria bacterium]|nr:HisA/HisF-related TIM barrel protein [Alphaproteobacteria bacterium]
MKKRIIPVVLIDAGGKVVISKRFDPWRTVGMLMQSLRMHDQRGADELLILDINATKENRTLAARVLKIISDNVRIPVTIGGGIRSLAVAKTYINSGADKVCLNSIVIDDFGILKKFSSSLGSQAVVVNINYVWQDGCPRVYDYREKSILGVDFLKYVGNIIEYGAGEIVVTSVEEDGKLNGFDIRMIKYLDQLNLAVPIIISGGGGNSDHYLYALSQNLSGVTGGTIFSLTENTPQTLRQICRLNGLPMREVEFKSC